MWKRARVLNEKQRANVYKKAEKLLNKDYEKIKKAFPTAKNLTKAFAEEIIDVMELNKTASIDTAVRGIYRSELFKSRTERLHENLLKKIRSDKSPGGSYETWRKLTRHQKIIDEAFTYHGWNEDGSAQIYTYRTQWNKIITIYLYKSPENAEVVG